MIGWTLEKRKLKDLVEHSKNPRRLSSDEEFQLRTSLEKFGLIDKIIINQDNTIIGGHQRKKTIKRLGYKEVDCWVPDRLLTDQEVDELNIRLNKNTGTWDFDVLANEWEATDLIEWGFTTEELFQSTPEQLAGEEESTCLNEKCELCGQKLKKQK